MAKIYQIRNMWAGMAILAMTGVIPALICLAGAKATLTPMVKVAIKKKLPLLATPPAGKIVVDKNAIIVSSLSMGKCSAKLAITAFAQPPAAMLALASETSNPLNPMAIEQDPQTSGDSRIDISAFIEDAKRAANEAKLELSNPLPSVSDQITLQPQSRLKQGIAAAYRLRSGPVKLTELTLPDGRPITKVTGPNGVYCVARDSVNRTRGFDQIQNGVRTRGTPCP